MVHQLCKSSTCSTSLARAETQSMQSKMEIMAEAVYSQVQTCRDHWPRSVRILGRKSYRTQVNRLGQPKRRRCQVKDVCHRLTMARIATSIEDRITTTTSLIIEVEYQNRLSVLLPRGALPIEGGATNNITVRVPQATKAQWVRVEQMAFKTSKCVKALKDRMTKLHIVSTFALLQVLNLPDLFRTSNGWCTSSITRQRVCFLERAESNSIGLQTRLAEFAGTARNFLFEITDE